MQIELKASIQNEHVTQIERFNRTMKDWICSVYTELIRVYCRVQGVLVRDLVYAATFWLNSFPAKDGVSAMLVLQAMINGQLFKFTKRCLLQFGDYVHTHEGRDNSMEFRTLEALALQPTGNSQG